MTNYKKNINVSSSESLITLIINLHAERKRGKLKIPRRNRLSLADRQKVLDKTGSKCHICGIKLKKNNFEADHVKSHISGGESTIDNYLPSCRICNNYRWHYLPEEIQLILKLGVWVKTKIEYKTKIGLLIAEGFISHEIKRMMTRKRIKNNFANAE